MILKAPLFLGCANPDGTPSSLLLDDYKEMASSGVSMVVVENIAVDLMGKGSPLYRICEFLYHIFPWAAPGKQHEVLLGLQPELVDNISTD